MMMRQESMILAQRVHEIRLERYGERGGPTLALAMDLPLRTWINYESGVTIPALVILRFIRLTGVSAQWLLSGQCGKYTESVASLPGVTLGSSLKASKGDLAGS
jgi:hypothetical protein